jgi:hypothetical protein
VVDPELRKAFSISSTGEWIEADRIEIAGGITIDVISILPS